MASESEKALVQYLQSGAAQDTLPNEADRQEQQTPTTTGPVKRRPVSRTNFLVHHDTHPIVLDIILMGRYNVEWFDWEPEALWQELQREYRVASISDHVKSKIHAARTVHLSDWCFTKWEVFCPVIQALNNNIPDFEVMRKPTLAQLFAGADMMSMVRNDIAFGEEVQQWCAAAVMDAGVTYAPQPIAFCQDAIDQFLKLRRIERDLEPIREKFKHYAATPAEHVELDADDPVDVQVAHLIVARDYMQLRRTQMTEQLKVMQ